MQLHACMRLSDEAVADLHRAVSPELGHRDEVEWLAPHVWRIYLSGFGNVTRGDATQLAELFRERLAGFEAPVLRLARVEPLIYPGDDSVWAGIEGDVEDLAALATAMPRWVHAFGFVPDRRKYRSWVQLGTVTPRTTLGYLEGLVSRLSAYQGPEFQPAGVTLATYRPAAVDHPAALDVFDTAEFRTAAAPHED